MKVINLWRWREYIKEVSLHACPVPTFFLRHPLFTTAGERKLGWMDI